MPGLNLALAPDAATPVRFLRWIPAWTLALSILVLWLDAGAWASRWHPGVLAVVHALVLGVLGNACLGALVQFLGAAVGAPVAGRPGLWQLLGVLHNLGTALLVAGFWLGHARALLLAGALVVAPALTGALVLMLRGLSRGAGDPALRRALMVPLIAWLGTVVLGAALVAGLSGQVMLDLPAWTDLHATLGLLGVFGGLLVVVSRTVAPMLLGLVRPRSRWTWPLAALAMGVLTLVLRMADAPGAARQAGMTMLLVACVAGSAWLWRRPWHRQRNRPLWSAWLLALLAGIGAGGIGLASGDQNPTLRFAVVASIIGGALPLAIVAMAIEINAFLAWISGHRRHPDAHLPNVHALCPDAGKWAWLVLQATTMAAIVWLVATHGAIARIAVATGFAASALALAWLLRRPWRAMAAWERR